MSFLESCEELFGTDNLYAILKIEKDATDAVIKRAYRKLSLQVHPDRAEPDKKKIHTQKFQIVSKIHCLLTDSEARKLYDETGEIDEENSTTQDRDWEDYWRLMYPKIGLDDIKQFEDKYKGSDEEIEDLKAAYLEFEGDMDIIMENVLCAEAKDESRFQKILKKLIKDKEIPDFDKFSKEEPSKKKARKRRAENEAQEAEQHAKDMALDVNGAGSLQALIKQRQASRATQADTFFDQLAEKYAKPQKSKKGKK